MAPSGVHQPFHERYELLEKLGEGGQAAVFKGVIRGPGQRVAIKAYKKEGNLELDACRALESGASELEDLSLEVKLLKQLHHAHIVTLFDVAQDDAHVYLVQELLEGGELFDSLLAGGALQEEPALDVFAQVCLAVDYLHGLSVAHRDIKTENLVFARRGSLDIKLCDFGTADTWTAAEPLTGLVGTPHYMAPEIVRGWYTSEADSIFGTSAPYGVVCDCWSLGVLLYELLSFTMPFRAAELGPLLNAVARGDFEMSPLIKARGARDLISLLLVADPSRRPAIGRVKQHPWLAAAVATREAAIETRPRSAEPMPKRPTLQAAPALTRGVESRPAPETQSSRPPLSPPSKSPLKRKDALAMKKLARRAKASRGQRYWFGGEVISPPANLTRHGSVQLGPDGDFVLTPDGAPLRVLQLDSEISQLKFHTGLAGDAEALYVVDNGSHRVRKLALSDGAPLACVGSWGSQGGQLMFPEGLALLGERVYVADGGNHRIAVFDKELSFACTFGSRGHGAGQLVNPCGLAVASEQRHLFVADSGNHRLCIFTEGGLFVRHIGSQGGAPGRFRDPCGVALAHGHLYVAEYNGRRMQVLTPSGEPLQTISVPGGEMLAGICAAEQRVYVADPDASTLHVLNVRAEHVGSPSARSFVAAVHVHA